MNTNHPLLASLADEPPPFPDSHPQLQRLDRSVLCTICKEIFRAPVTVTCGHTFCSECIRSSLSVMTDKKCPLCHATITEGSIRRNRAMEEVTEAWETARDSLITLSQPVAGPSRRRPPPEPNSKSSSSTSANLKRPRRSDESRSQSPNKISKKSTDHVDHVVSSDSEEEEQVQEISENDEGECPLCSARMAIASIPMHIERGCPPVSKKKSAPGNQKADWRKVFSMAGSTKEKNVSMKRITSPNYHLATPTDLRNILNEYSLPTVGDKPALEARVRQWIILFNSNLDTEHPKSLSALRAKLNAEEISKKRDKERGRDEAVENLKTTEGFAEHVRNSGAEFERLRKEIMERDAKRAKAAKGLEASSAIEVD
ncbi:hypothetical protein BD324DRAFT_591711 [Kockovaella imperatae]|uniref:Postreplication repair E3 ubiquitin-protein ligase RAD18 n=1 Tax=Kockovaella imperatae TaxID=4999 RepID=A0A1Y1UEJ0_9TREE|nr:hypothetical protein BD324DRAFT_591711 [Kockovaella imperatae]ORX36409.1 hypothetical protein BD324DRAFT_591711 [Kockovaella imperatae]